MNIGEKIQKLRKDGGFSQESFAEALGVSRQSVFKWESGASLPDTDKIIAISELFGVSTDYLLKQDADETESKKADKSETESEPTEEAAKKKKKFSPKKIIALAAALCVLVVCAAFPVRYGGVREAWWAVNGGKVQYAYVLVHGLGGWGEGAGINSVASYWGAESGNIVDYLENQGFSVCAPCVGPVSSTWDRACELYAQLTGTRVDYGEAHSRAHSHSRYGREYSEPLIENWGKKINGGQRVKVNLIGHSFGGTTVRMLANLLAFGDEAELAATGKDTSPLFTGGKEDWVFSVTTLCAPHNGSSLTCALDDVGAVAGISNTTDLLVSCVFAMAGITAPAKGIYDFMLDQFGIGQINGGISDIRSAVSRITETGTDNAGYELTPDGAAELNEKIKTADGVYYFSYSYVTTKEGGILKGQTPASGTFALLYPTALAMGTYSGTTAGGKVIDESWQPNDGLVSVVSAKYPEGEERTDWNPEEKVQRGIWNVMPVKNGHHGTVIGLGADSNATRDFYVNLIQMTDSLKR